ncbi:MAG: FtsW/RodA/SpoVE family cell cycle protein, partial [Endozoicomonas sp.]
MLKITGRKSILERSSKASEVEDAIRLKSFDTLLLGLVLLMLAVGLVMVGSASMDVSNTTFGNPFRIVIKQLVFMLAGLGAMGVMLFIPISRIQQYSWAALFVAFFLLFAVLLVGREINGSIRWIPLGFFN